MNKTEAMATLESLGTAQNRKVYARHGVAGKQFGVSYANLGVLKKKIGVDHDLAARLWATGNHDARILATMIADPDRMSAGDLDAWARDLGNYVIADAVAGVAARSGSAWTRMTKWTRARDEWTSSAGYGLLARLALEDDSLDEAALEASLETIEATIHRRPNRTRYSMNNALIAIGARSPRLQKTAVAAARRIGPVEVDHGETGCRTPDAVSYIAKTVAHRKQRDATRRKKTASRKRASHKTAPARTSR